MTEAAVTGARDRLLGLKENVIIGRLIPARANFFAEGAKQLVAAQEEEGFSSPWYDISETPLINNQENGNEIDEEIFGEDSAE